MDIIDSSNRRRQRKGGHSLKPTRGIKSFSMYNKRKRGRSFVEEEDSSEKDSEKDSDEDFNNRTKRGMHLQKKIVSRTTMSANIMARNNEVRTSSRSIRKISYAESEESEDFDDGKAKKSQKVWTDYDTKLSYNFVIFIAFLMFMS